MKLLRLFDNRGEFLAPDNNWHAIDRITKDDLLRLANLTLEQEDVEFDEYDEQFVKHLAHRVIYKSVVQKLQDLRARRKEFVDESARLFYQEYENYKKELPAG